MCVPDRRCQAGQQGMGGGGGRPMFPQGLAEGKGPEDSRRPLEAEGLGGTVL